MRVIANYSSVHLRHFLSKKSSFYGQKQASKPTKPYSHLTTALYLCNNICRHICHCVSCDGSVSSESSVQYKQGKAVWAVYEAVLTLSLMVFSFFLAQNFWLDRLWCLHLYPRMLMFQTLCLKQFVIMEFGCAKFSNMEVFTYIWVDSMRIMQ